MKKRILYVCFALIWLAIPSTLEAESLAALQPDTLRTTMPADSAIIHHTDTLTKSQKGQPFNALDYALQKRHQAKRCQFPHSSHFWHNTYFALGGSLEKLVSRSGVDMARNNLISLTAGKDFNAFHGMRLSVQGGYANSTTTPDKYKRWGIRAAYLFNPTAYIWGYDPYRTFETLLSAGLGGGSTTYQSNTNFFGELSLGIQFKFHLQKQLNLFIEPSLSLYTDGVDVHHYANWHKYDLGYGLTVGLNYYLKDPMRATRGRYAKQEKDFWNDLTLSLALGGQFQISDDARAIGLFRSANPHVQFSVNKWFSHPFGLRLSPFFGTDTWKRHYDSSEANQNSYQNLQSYYYGLRLEAMLDFVQLASPNDNHHPFTVIALAGLEAGGIRKQDVYTQLHDTYLGFTAGLQFKLRLSNSYSIFLEPAYSFVPYSYLPEAFDGSYLDRMNFSDHLFRLNIGLEYNLSNLLARKHR